MEHKVVLLVVLLRALRCETLSLTPFRETDQPLYVVTGSDQRSVKPEQETGGHEFSCKHNDVLSALSRSQKFCWSVQLEGKLKFSTVAQHICESCAWNAPSCHPAELTF